MLRFIGETHQYFDGEIELPSVTHITRFLQTDVASGAKDWLRDIAADRGRRVHEYCADIDYGAEPETIDWDCVGYVQAYRTFKRDYRIKEWQAIETPLGSAETGFAGTLDRLGYIDGRLTIVDLKTGATVHKTAWAAQLTGYSYLVSLLTGEFITPEKLMILQLKKNGKYRFIECEFEYEAFNACKLLNKKLEGK